MTEPDSDLSEWPGALEITTSSSVHELRTVKDIGDWKMVPAKYSVTIDGISTPTQIWVTNERTRRSRNVTNLINRIRELYAD